MGFFFRFLGHFIDECGKIASPKLKLAKENAKTSQDDFKEVLSTISDLEKVWKEVKMEEKKQHQKYRPDVTFIPGRTLFLLFDLFVFSYCIDTVING